MESPPRMLNGLASGALSHADLGHRLDSFTQSDQERNRLLHELVGNYQRLDLRAAELQADLENEQRSRREWQNRASELEMKVQKVSRVSDANPKVAVLIDGDGAPFLDELYARGEDGGSDAAYRLYDELKKHISALFPDESTSHWSIIVYMFVNAEGLNAKLHACGILPPTIHLDKFGSAFSSAQSLFQFVPVKPGKEQADYKLRHWFQVYLNDIQCKHIVLGGICHDNGYLPLLEPHKHNVDAPKRMSLLATLPAQQGFKQMHFKPLRIPSVFRSEHLPSKPTNPGTVNGSNGMSLPPAQRKESSAKVSEHSNGAQQINPSLAPTSSSPESWARVSKNPNENVKEYTIPLAKKAAPKKFMLYNKDQHRLDVPVPFADKASQERLYVRIKESGKICNSYHLTGKCPGGCGFVHGEKLSPGEYNALKYRARTRLCMSKGWCADIDCTMGHVCPYTANCQGKGCAFEETHGVDLIPAMKWYEDQTIERIGTV